MFEHENGEIELISVFPYKEGDTWFFRLIYEVEDTETGEIRVIIIPKCANPFSEKSLKLDYKEDRWPFDPEIFGLEHPHPKPVTSCHLINEYCKLPVLLAYDDSINGSDPFYYEETIIKPATPMV